MTLLRLVCFIILSQMNFLHAATAKGIVTLSKVVGGQYVLNIYEKAAEKLAKDMKGVSPVQGIRYGRDINCRTKAPFSCGILIQDATDGVLGVFLSDTTLGRAVSPDSAGTSQVESFAMQPNQGRVTILGQVAQRLYQQLHPLSNSAQKKGKDYTCSRSPFGFSCVLHIENAVFGSLGGGNG